jgi:hypothetical protein
MKKFTLLSAFSIAAISLFAQKTAIPHLEKNGNATQLIVQGKPFLILGGELHNSSTSGADYMRPIWDQMKRKNLNTVIAPVYWEMLEPQEGKFDFALVDSMIYGARKSDLHLVVLWFGTWKNGYSMYAPGWVKNNTAKYPRAKNKNGESFEMISALSDAAMKADANAFKMLMTHIRAIDEKYQTVITAQIENEMGLFSTPRDFSDEATKAFNSNVPVDLMKYLSANKEKLQPELDSAWKANGYKTSGTWEEVFGKSMNDNKDWHALSYLPEELFTVYHYAKYAGGVAAAGKEAYSLPMYVNAWIKQPGMGLPGKYPVGGPVPHTLDIWRSEAPAIDFISPDIYVSQKDARYTIEQYHRPGNPVFIPEYRPGLQSASEAFWAYGQHDAICFSPFGIDETKPEDDPITKTYAALSQVKDLILQNQGKGTMVGIYVDTLEKVQTFQLNGYNIKAELMGVSIAELAGFTNRTKPSTFAGGILIATGPDEFIIVGKDFSLSMVPLKTDPGKPLLDVEYLDEGTFVNGKWVTTRRLNGDEGTGGGDYGFGFSNNKTAMMRFQKKANGDCSIIRFKIYRYK